MKISQIAYAQGFLDMEHLAGKTANRLKIETEVLGQELRACEALYYNGAEENEADDWELLAVRHRPSGTWVRLRPDDDRAVKLVSRPRSGGWHERHARKHKDLAHVVSMLAKHEQTWTLSRGKSEIIVFTGKVLLKGRRDRIEVIPLDTECRLRWLTKSGVGWVNGKAVPAYASLPAELVRPIFRQSVLAPMERYGETKVFFADTVGGRYRIDRTQKEGDGVWRLLDDAEIETWGDIVPLIPQQCEGCKSTLRDDEAMCHVCGMWRILVREDPLTCELARTGLSITEQPKRHIGFVDRPRVEPIRFLPIRVSPAVAGRVICTLDDLEPYIVRS